MLDDHESYYLKLKALGTLIYLVRKKEKTNKINIKNKDKKKGESKKHFFKRNRVINLYGDSMSVTNRNMSCEGDCADHPEVILTEVLCNTILAIEETETTVPAISLSISVL